MIRKILFAVLIIILCFPCFSTVKKKYKGSFLVETINEDDEVSEREVLTYSDGHLIFTSYFTSNSDVPECIEYYIRAKKDGRLIGVRRLNRTSIFGDSFLYQEETMYLKAAPNLVVDSTFEVSNVGNIVYEKDGIKKVYTADGVLLSSEDSSGVREYCYDEYGNLSSVTLVSGVDKIISTYKGTDLIKEDKYTDDLIVYSVEYLPSGKVKTIYEKGVKTAEIIFEKNNVRIDRIEYY